MTDPITTPAQMREASIYYIDCEFDGHSGPLLSLAMVRCDGYSTHIRVNLDAKDPWVQANVMPIMDSHNADVSETVDLVCVGQSIRDFIGTCQHPTIIADSPVDIWRFCAAISTASDGQWSSVDYPKISFAVHNVACYPTTLAGAVQHNAWWDAMALRDTLCRALPVAEPAPVADGSFYKEVDIDRLQERAEKAEAERDRLRAALIDHNDLLRSAMQICSRAIQHEEFRVLANWDAFHDRISVCLKRHHATSNDARATLAKLRAHFGEDK